MLIAHPVPRSRTLALRDFAPHLSGFERLWRWICQLQKDQTMADDKINVEIYTSGICAYCVAAKNLLKQKGLDYTEIRIDADPAKFDEMRTRTQRRTVPQIFIAGHFIGGYDDLVAADRSGELAKLIGKAA
jgi:glutaredoxin 3